DGYLGKGRLLLFRRGGQDSLPAVETDRAAGGSELVLGSGDGDDGGVELRGRHLRGDKLSPDEVVEPCLVRLERGLFRGRNRDVGGTNCLVSLLGALLRRVGRRGRRQVLGAA